MSFLRGIAGILVVLAMAALGALFALQNDARVPLDILVFQFPPRSLALWVLAAFAIGGVLGLLMGGFVVMGLRARLRLLRRQLTRTQGEADRLRGKGVLARD